MIAGYVVLWLVVIVLVMKPLTVSLTSGIGGSGGCSHHHCSPAR
jgi:hypothetical protein